MICVGHVTLYRGLAWPKWGRVGLTEAVLKAVAISTLNAHSIDCGISTYGVHMD